MKPDEYIKSSSLKYLSKQVNTFEELTEEDADTWITKAYLQSFEVE